MFERPASTVEKWYRITKVGEFLQQLVFSDELQGLLLMNCCVLCLHNRPVEQLYFFHSSSHITSSVPQVLLTMLELVLACVAAVSFPFPIARRGRKLRECRSPPPYCSPVFCSPQALSSFARLIALLRKGNGCYAG